MQFIRVFGFTQSGCFRYLQQAQLQPSSHPLVLSSPCLSTGYLGSNTAVLEGRSGDRTQPQTCGYPLSATLGTAWLRRSFFPPSMFHFFSCFLLCVVLYWVDTEFLFIAPQKISLLTCETPTASDSTPNEPTDLKTRICCLRAEVSPVVRLE